jgi:hypothetical protein
MKADPHLKGRTHMLTQDVLKQKTTQNPYSAFRKRKEQTKGQNLYNSYSSLHTVKMMTYRTILGEHNENV